MKKFLLVTALAITLANVSVGVAYACTCYDQVGSCSASGSGAECYHDAQGRCHCKTGHGVIEEELAN